MVFPPELWTRIYSTNPLERLNKEVKRRTNVVGVFPDGSSATRLVGAVLLEIADEWQVGRRYFSLEAMARVIEPQPLLVRSPCRFTWHLFTEANDRNLSLPWKHTSKYTID